WVKASVDCLRVFGWLRLPKDTPISYIHAGKQHGGLGIPSLSATIPMQGKTRMEKLLSTQCRVLRNVVNVSAFGKIVRDLSLPIRVHSACVNTKEELVAAWGESLHNSVDGRGLRELVTSPLSNRWLVFPERVFPRLFIRGIQLRRNLLRARVRSARHGHGGQTILCRGNCGQPESLVHISQSCWITHDARCARHNRAVIGLGLPKVAVIDLCLLAILGSLRTYDILCVAHGAEGTFSSFNLTPDPQLRKCRTKEVVRARITNLKVRGSNPTSATRLPLSRLGQPGSIPALVLPSGGMAARHRKGATAERFIYLLLSPPITKIRVDWISIMKPSTSVQLPVSGLLLFHPDRKVSGLNSTPAYRLFLSTLEQPVSISAFVLSGSVAARHRKGAIAERVLAIIIIIIYLVADATVSFTDDSGIWVGRRTLEAGADKLEQRFSQCCCGYLTVQMFDNCCLRTVARVGGCRRTRTEEVKKRIIYCVCRTIVCRRELFSEQKQRGGQPFIWQKGVKEITKRLGPVGTTCLLGCGPRDPHFAWLEALQERFSQCCCGYLTVQMFDNCCLRTVARVGGCRRTRTEEVKKRIIYCVCRTIVCRRELFSEQKQRGGQPFIWQKGVKEITKRLGPVGTTCLLGCGPRDPHFAWLEALQGKGANRSR
ncbi:hypothetical protein T265_13578, partial [Opisthorchis viverrini]